MRVVSNKKFPTIGGFRPVSWMENWRLNADAGRDAERGRWNLTPFVVGICGIDNSDGERVTDDDDNDNTELRFDNNGASSSSRFKPPGIFTTEASFGIIGPFPR